MTLFIFCGILIGAIVFFVEKKREKTNRIKVSYPLRKTIELYLLFVVIVGMCANQLQGDAGAFYVFYEFIKDYGYNPWDYTYDFFAYIVRVFIEFFPNATVYEFRAFFCLIGWCLILYAYRKFAYSYSSVFFLYSLAFMFAHDGAQIKNFIALSFVLLAISIFIGRSKNYLIKYYIIMFIAILFHFSCVVYLLIPIIGTKWYKRIETKIPVYGLGIYIFFYLVGTKITSLLLINIASVFPFLRKLESYSGAYSGRRSIVFLGLYFLGYFLLAKCKKNEKELSEEKRYFFENVLAIWRLMGIVLPCLIYANAAYRLFRNLLILIFICATNSTVCYKRFSKERLMITIYIVVFEMAILAQPILFNSYIDVFVPIFYGEFFWK